MPDIKLQEYLAQIESLIEGDRPDEAIAHCQHILRLYPKHVQTYRVLGTACLAKGMDSDALDLFHRTLSADPEDVTAWLGVSSAHQAQGRLADAIWAMERAFALAPGEPEVRKGLERLYSQRNGTRQHKLTVTRDALGRIYARNGLGEKAIIEFRAALDRNPDLPDVRVALLETLWREGRYLEAAEACLQVLKGLPYCLKANLVLGAIRIQNGQKDAGRTRLDVANALDPENLLAVETMAEASPLPVMSVLVPQLAGISLPSSGAPDEAEMPGADVPAWARELKSIENGAPARADGLAERAQTTVTRARVLPAAPADDTPFLAAIRRRLQVYVELGTLNEVDLYVGLAELAESTSASERTRAQTGWLSELLGPQQLADILQDASEELDRARPEG